MWLALFNVGNLWFCHVSPFCFTVQQPICWNFLGTQLQRWITHIKLQDSGKWNRCFMSSFSRVPGINCLWGKRNQWYNFFPPQFNTSYNPNMWRDAKNDIDKGTFMIEVPLWPWASYSFRVFAQNEIGISPPSPVSSSCWIGPDTLDKNPDNVLGAGRKCMELSRSLFSVELTDQFFPSSTRMSTDLLNRVQVTL